MTNLFGPKIFVFTVSSKNYSGPFFSFEAALSHAVRFGKDVRIETEDDKVLASWSQLTGLYKTGTVYKYLVIDNAHNRAAFPDLIGQTLDKAPSFAMVVQVEAA